MKKIWEKLKSGFNNLYKNKRFFIFLFFILLIGLIIPTQKIEAGPWDWARGIGTNTADAFLSALQALPLGISIAVAWTGSTILNLVTSREVISECYACVNNPIIAVGWPLMRDIANIIIVASLIVIGLATALRINEYQAQKTLVPLLIAAVLVNFSLVIVGVVVDFSNIFMDFFLDQLSESGAWKKLLPTATSSPPDMRAVADNHIKFATVIVYNISLGLIFLLFSVLFIMRYVAIWFLAIFAPLAFASNVFPKTKKFFDQWLNQLIQWSFIGVTAAFFLYLTNKLMEGLVLVEPSGSDASFVGSILNYFVVIATMFLGLIASITTGASGTSQVTSFAKRQGTAYTNMASNYTKKKALGAGEYAAKAPGNVAKSAGRGLSRAATGIKEFGERQATSSNPFKRGLGKTIGATSTASSGLGDYFKRTRVGRDIAETNKERNAAEQAEYRQKTKGQSAERQSLGFNSPFATDNEKIARVDQAIEDGTFPEFKKNLKPSAIASIAKWKAQTDPKGTQKIISAVPELAEDIARELPEEVRKKLDLIPDPVIDPETGQQALDAEGKPIFVTITEKVTARIKPNLVVNMDKESFNNENVKRGMMHWSAAHIKQLAEHHKEGFEAFKKAFKKTCEEDIGWFEDNNNSALLNWAQSNAGRSLIGDILPENSQESGDDPWTTITTPPK